MSRISELNGFGATVRISFKGGSNDAVNGCLIRPRVPCTYEDSGAAPTCAMQLLW